MISAAPARGGIRGTWAIGLACGDVVVGTFVLSWLLLSCTADVAPAEAVAVAPVALRPNNPGASATPPAYDSDDEVLTFDTPEGFFRVHYTSAGEHAVPTRDANDDGVPDYVAQVGDEYEAVLAFFGDELGFRAPLSDADVEGDNGGDGRFDVYLLDFPNSADGAYRRLAPCLDGGLAQCPGYMLQENDFDGRGYGSLREATRVLASHELFHAVQNAYNADAGQVIGEGTAVWASEAYDGQLSDFEAFVTGYLERPERSLGQEPTGPVDAFAYGSALFFRFLDERYDRALLRQLWQGLADASPDDEPEGDGEAVPPAWLSVLDDTLAEEHDSSVAEAFAEFAEWNLYTGRRADGGYGYRNAGDYPEVGERQVALPYQDEGLRVFPLSARHFVADVEESGDVCVAVAAGADGDIAGIRLVLANEASWSIEQLARAEVQAAGEPSSLMLSDVTAGDSVHVVVLSTRLAGESLRPDVCLGACDDVAECAGEAAADMDETDAHEADGEAGDAEGAAARRSGCSVHAPAGGARGGTCGQLVAALLVLGSRLRRRLRCRR